jgi:HK97 family phage portal protein
VSIFFQKRATSPTVTADMLIPGRMGTGVGSVLVTSDSALRHSAVWACLRLRSDLISTMPVDSFRKAGDIDVPLPNAPVLVNPGGERVGMQEWLYSSQIDLDRVGNAFGLITQRTSSGLPLRIDLQAHGDVSVIMKGGQLSYRIGGTVYPPEQVWHERQFTVAGLPVGLSPVAYSAMTIGQYQSAQQFAISWYGAGTGQHTPAASLKNTQQKISPEVADGAKARFKAAISTGDIFVHGSDWEFSTLEAAKSDTAWLDAMDASAIEVARFFGCPGDLIDAASKGSAITYANITQRNLQFLVMHLGPAIARRETALSSLLPRPRFVKFNTSSLLRMDDATRAQLFATQIASRTRAPSEAREKDNLEPFTDVQLAEFDRIFGAPGSMPAPPASPTTPPPSTGGP